MDYALFVEGQQSPEVERNFVWTTVTKQEQFADFFVVGVTWQLDYLMKMPQECAGLQIIY